MYYRRWSILAAVLAGLLAGLFAAGAADLHAEAPPKGPVQVFILAGQSNMEGHGSVEMGRDPADAANPDAKSKPVEGGLGSLRRLVTQQPDRYGPAGKTPLVGKDGQWLVRDDVWIWATTDKGERGRLAVGFGARDTIGPEFGFGHVVGNHADGPVLIIKTSWGGKDLAVDFRTPSAGPAPEYVKGKRREAIDADGALVGHFYRLMLEHVKDVRTNLATYFPELAGRETRLAGFGWHQGWNDGCSADMTAEYESNLVHFIRDLRKDLGAESLPVVIATSGFGGREQAQDRRLGIINAQLAVADAAKHPEFKGTVAAVETRDFWRPVEQSPSRQGYHWNGNGETHYLIGEAMGRAMIDLMK